MQATNAAAIQSAPSKDNDTSLSDYLEDFERREILKALEKSNNNKIAAAKLLDVSFRTLRYRLSKLGLSKDDPAASDDDLAEEN